MKTTTVSIPDGLGAFLQQRFGGTLVAPVQPNPCGHSADSNASLTEMTTEVSNKTLLGAATGYYESFGCRIEGVNMSQTTFSVAHKDFELIVALTNYSVPPFSSRKIRISVTELG